MKKISKIIQSKKHPKVTDPPRYPRVINGYEGAAKIKYSATLKKTYVEIIKELSSQLKN